MTLETKSAILETVKLRPAESQDREALVEMYQTFEPKGASLGLPPRINQDAWLARLACHFNFVLELEGRLVGHGVLCAEDSSAEVAVFIHQEYRGAGLGKLLLAHMVEEARRLGFRRVWGVTELDNVPMLRLAHSLGFRRGEDPGEFSIELQTVEDSCGSLTTAA
jgi:L-amino acid N-acyltransferase YncA